MKLLKLLGQLPAWLWSIAISVPVYMCLLFVAVYLFERPLIGRIETVPFWIDLDFWFVVCVCLCLSLAWYAVGFFNMFAWLAISEGKQHIDIKKPDVHVLSAIFGALYLGIVIYQIYTDDVPFRSSFKLAFWTGAFLGVAGILYVAAKRSSRPETRKISVRKPRK